MDNNYTFKATAFELNDSIKDYFKKRLDGLFNKYDIVNRHMNVEIGRTTSHHKHGDVFFAEAHFSINKHPKNPIFAKAERADVYEAIDHLQRELLAQLEAGKGKRFALFKRGAAKIKSMLQRSKAEESIEG